MSGVSIDVLQTNPDINLTVVGGDSVLLEISTGVPGPQGDPGFVVDAGTVPSSPFDVSQADPSFGTCSWEIFVTDDAGNSYRAHVDALFGVATYWDEESALVEGWSVLPFSISVLSTGYLRFTGATGLRYTVRRVRY